MNPDQLWHIESEMLLKAPGTMYEGLGLDTRPEQGSSPVPYLTLRELAKAVYIASEICKTSRILASTISAARSVARTAEIVDRRACGGPLENDQRRCSTADQSGLPDFVRFGELTLAGVD